ncbi:hypothetical protein LJR231_002202 [Phyllobacterium sp. LjRoot231]|uniref:hypothetical protein n=1 Tax=Phyllobacterium sp. LjRoot231 TaxID=3342289 RepID=UPI003ECCCEEE
MCCALTALLIALITAWRTRFKTVLDWWPRVRTATTLGTATIVLIAGSALAAEHVSHYVARAHANERTVLAEFMAQPICRGY